MESEKKGKKEIFIENLVTPKESNQDSEIKSTLKSSIPLRNKLNHTESYRSVLESICNYDNYNQANNFDNCTIIEEETEELITNSAFSIKKKSMFYGPLSSKKAQSPIYIKEDKAEVTEKLDSVAFQLKSKEINLKNSLDMKKKAVLEHFQQKERNKSKDFNSLVVKNDLILNNLMIEHPTNMTLTNKSTTKNFTLSSTHSESNISKKSKVESFKITREVNIEVIKKIKPIRNISIAKALPLDSLNPNINKIKVTKKIPLFTVQSMRMVPDK